MKILRGLQSLCSKVREMLKKKFSNMNNQKLSKTKHHKTIELTKFQMFLYSLKKLNVDGTKKESGNLTEKEYQQTQNVTIYNWTSY